MKFLLVLALAAGLFLWYRNENIKKEEKVRADAAAVEAKRAEAATPVPAVTTGNKLIYDSATGRYIEPKSLGSRAAAKPKGRTMLDQPAHR
jgi:hypothetical protein